MHGGGDRAAVMNSLIGTAKLNSVDPQAWLADVLAGITDMPMFRLYELGASIYLARSEIL